MTAMSAVVTFRTVLAPIIKPANPTMTRGWSSRIPGDNQPGHAEDWDESGPIGSEQHGQCGQRDQPKWPELKDHLRDQRGQCAQTTIGRRAPRRVTVRPSGRCAGRAALAAETDAAAAHGSGGTQEPQPRRRARSRSTSALAQPVRPPTVGPLAPTSQAPSYSTGRRGSRAHLGTWRC